MRRYLFLLLFVLATSAKADLFTLTINSAPYNDGQHGVGFYNSTVTYDNGPNDVTFSYPVQTICIDFTHSVGFNQPFEINIVNLHVFDGALHDNYWQAGWLSLQLQGVTDIATISDIQRAIWLITTPGTDNPYLTTEGAFTWANQAALNYQSVSDSNFVLFLRAGQDGQSQLAVVPEPEAYACFILGGVSLVGFHMMGRKQRRARK